MNTSETFYCKPQYRICKPRKGEKLCQCFDLKNNGSVIARVAQENTISKLKHQRNISDAFNSAKSPS